MYFICQYVVRERNLISTLSQGSGCQCSNIPCGIGRTEQTQLVMQMLPRTDIDYQDAKYGDALQVELLNTHDPNISQAATVSRRRMASSGCLKLQEPTSVLPMYPASF